MPTPNEAMRKEAQRGLDWRSEYGRGGTEVGIARARDISNGENLSMSTVRRMVSYFARHEVDKEAEGFRPGEDGYPSNGRIAWALWGGDAGRSWANRQVAEDEGRQMAGNMEKQKSAKAQPFELRAHEGGAIRVAGYAAVFNEEADIGGQFTEVIERGAFTNAIERGDDVVFLVNHDGLPLARTRSGTLRLSEDERGLYMETELDPNDPDVRAIVPKMKRGDLDKMSFAFSAEPNGHEWDQSGDKPKRIIRDVWLHDVAIVNSPAYDGTEIGLRSLEQHRAKPHDGRAKLRMSMRLRLMK